ncbi:dihydroneopterin aldolase [Bacteroidota bacterium]
MGQIQIEGMEFYAHHGHFAEERIIGNKFLLDLFIDTDCKKAAETDKLEDALNYQEVYEIVKQEMKIKSHLLENVAGRILDELYNRFDTIKNVRIKVSKMNPPMGGKIEKVSVCLSR